MLSAEIFQLLKATATSLLLITYNDRSFTDFWSIQSKYHMQTICNTPFPLASIFFY